MEAYNYLDAVKSDVLEYIRENEINVTAENREEVESELNDSLFCNDSVTGNASGSYWFNARSAAECLCHNWDLLADAISEFGGDVDILRQGEEACDVTIRCYVLAQAIAEALDELENEN